MIGKEEIPQTPLYNYYEFCIHISLINMIWHVIAHCCTYNSLEQSSIKISRAVLDFGSTPRKLCFALCLNTYMLRFNCPVMALPIYATNQILPNLKVHSSA